MSVPNQRNITINKQPTNKQNLFTANNLDALDQAAGRLTSAAGFKLYMYLAKNQDKYNFWLSSADFESWASVGQRAYTTAFNELVEQGYLILKDGTKDIFIFNDLSQKADERKKKKNDKLIEVPEEKVNEVKEAREKGFIF